jgi:quercetin dioxygenase-like cupin family protein
MALIEAESAKTYDMHGVRFVAYVNPGRGSKELCAWRTELPAGADEGQPHTITREEVFLVLEGRVRVTIDGESDILAVGDAAVAPAGSSLRLDNAGDDKAACWVTTSVGIEAELPDGSHIVPPWAQ